ncbi:DUF4258 domain-containing protein [Ruminococcus sp. HUN007]|uniref:DUF4258 domain-containing protein n=1 Tax=Ruminococcus sp. HUN007 TaxID=1514668 RepID=UPI0005D2782C|nr:DUF4258 domain-containing protein [Ruminococcus sp. HUN007]
MIDIEKLRIYDEEDNIYVTEHASERFRQRGIKIKDIRVAIHNGEIIEQYPEDYPFPSCLIYGNDSNDNPIHVCMSDEGTSSRIITAYHPDLKNWNEDLKTRKENKQ